MFDILFSKAYKFRLYPNAAQRELITKTFDFKRFVYNQKLEDKIAHYNKSQNARGQYYISILTEYEVDLSPIKIEPQNVLGLDMDMKTCLPIVWGTEPNTHVNTDRCKSSWPCTSEGSLAVFTKAVIIISKEERYPGSRKKTANQRRDFLHKLSCQITNDYNAVCVESLNMKAMSQCLNLGKSSMANDWGLFAFFLNYKLEDRGKLLVKVDIWYPSSQTCSVCGKINQTLALSDRTWVCCGCSTCHDRDVNAAINIKNEGLRLVTA